MRQVFRTRGNRIAGDDRINDLAGTRALPDAISCAQLHYSVEKLSLCDFLTSVFCRHAVKERVIHHSRQIVDIRMVVRSDNDVSAERSEEHTSELQSLAYLVCRLLLEKKNHKTIHRNTA